MVVLSTMCCETEVVAMVSMFSEEKGCREERRACLKTLVGDIRHNILSTTTLCKLGWEFCQRPDGFHVRDLKSGAQMSDACSILCRMSVGAFAPGEKESSVLLCVCSLVFSAI